MGYPKADHILVNFLGLIVARSGSKGIPNKNLTTLAGRPLITYTCEAALRSGVLDRVVVSTDSRSIQDECVKHGVEAPFIRPAELAQDGSLAIDVAIHALDWLEQHESYLPDAMVLLQPTSPLRNSSHICEAVEVFTNRKADTVVSIVSVPHRFATEKQMVLEDDWLRSLDSGFVDASPRQHQRPRFARNGPAILITRTDVIRNSNSFYGDRVAAYVMSHAQSADIDTPLDLEWAEFLLSRYNN